MQQPTAQLTLPPRWKAHYDEHADMLYYNNVETGSTTWDRPVAQAVPSVESPDLPCGINNSNPATPTTPATPATGTVHHPNRSRGRGRSRSRGRGPRRIAFLGRRPIDLHEWPCLPHPPKEEWFDPITNTLQRVFFARCTLHISTSIPFKQQCPCDPPVL